MQPSLAVVVALTQTDVFLKNLCYRTLYICQSTGVKIKTTRQYPNDGKHCESLFLDDPINKSRTQLP